MRARNLVRQSGCCRTTLLNKCVTLFLSRILAHHTSYTITTSVSRVSGKNKSVNNKCTVQCFDLYCITSVGCFLGRSTMFALQESGQNDREITTRACWNQ